MIARALAMLGVAACVHRGGAMAADAPRLDAITPDSVAMAPGSVVDVVLEGRGFLPGAPGRNTVVFDGMLIQHVPANASGTAIRLTVPSGIRRGAEPAPAVLAPGAYAVSVRTPAGETAPRTLRVVP